MALQSSQDAIDLIVNEEVSSQAYYVGHYEHPTWPGGASGVTIGIGYDCGYATASQITADWSGKIPDAMVVLLVRVAGISGSPAHSQAAELVGSVTIPLQAAMSVFMDRDMPKWENIVRNVLLNTDKLSSDSFGAITSLAYNRGPSFHTLGDRYREMVAIADDMRTMDFEDIPAQFRSMKRLWPNVLGLRLRREHEAVLFEKGLATVANA